MEWLRLNKVAKPNIIIAVVDTLRADRLSNYGYHKEISPFIDHFAANCNLYNRCLSAASWTLVANASILTGDYPQTHGLINHEHVLSEKTPLISEILQKEDYYTAAYVENKNFQFKFGYTRGFKEFHSEYLHTIQSDSKHIIGHNPTKHTGIKDHNHIFELAYRFLEKAYNQHQPFFLWFHTNLVHDFYFDFPYLQVPDYNGKIKNGVHQDLIKFPPFWKSLNSEDLDAVVARYDHSIKYTDEKLRKLFDLIKLENTLVVLLGDHGEGFDPENRKIYHCGRLHNDLLHVPLIIHHPDGKISDDISKICSTVDVVPTILDYLGVTGAHFDGVSLFDKQEREISAFEKGYLYFWHLIGIKPIEWFTNEQKELERMRLSYRSGIPFEINSKVSSSKKTILTRIRDHVFEENCDLDDNLKESNVFINDHRSN